MRDQSSKERAKMGTCATRTQTGGLLQCQVPEATGYNGGPPQPTKHPRGGPYCFPQFAEGNSETQRGKLPVPDHPVRLKAEVGLEPGG